MVSRPSFSIGSSDGNDNGKKAKGLNKQSNYSAPTALFLVRLYAVIARLRRETSNKFPFLWRTTKDDCLFFGKFSELGHGLVGELNKVE